MERLTAVELPQHFEDPRDLAAGHRFGPGVSVAPEEGAEIAVPRIFERQVVEHLSVGAHQRKHVVDIDGARVSFQQLPEVRLAQPAVDAAR